MRWLAVIALSCAIPAASPATAEVTGASDTGFEVRRQSRVAASPEAVWATLIAPASWWSSAHSWSGSAANMPLDPRPGGCFCERLPDGGGVEHLRVVYAAPGKSLRMTGALGPLQGDALAGVMTIGLKVDGAGTSVTLTYAVAGRRTGGFAALAPAVDAVLAEQVTRLKAAAERR
jgi:uncharacterized protein YndB with AHSA1/START domain